MNDYVLSTCSACDLSEEYLAELEIPYVPFHFIVNGKDFFDNHGKDMPVNDLYKAMRDGADVKSAQVALGEYVDYFTSFLKQGKDILHLTLSTGISGTYNSAVSAAEMLKEEYPDRKIYIVDSLAASSGYGLLMAMLADKKRAGMDIDSLKAEAESLRHRINHLFFTTDLTFFIKGGRVSKAEGLIGNLLNICPLMCVSPDGRLVPVAKCKGKKKAIAKTISEMEVRIKDGANYDGMCFISHSDCEADANEVKSLVEAFAPALKDKIKVFPIGTTIGVHTGPGTVALFFVGGEDRVV